MLYLLDANTLIDANRDYYPIGQVDDYWSWLVELGHAGRIKIQSDIFTEFRDGKTDALSEWAKQQEVRDALLLDEATDVSRVRRVIGEGYADNLTDTEIEEIGADPFMIAAALADPGNRVVVSTEKSKPSLERQKRKVPDVCHTFGIRCIHQFEFIKELNFRTGR